MTITNFILGMAAGAGLLGIILVVLGLAAKNRDMDRRVSKLEEASRKRIPYGVAEEVMDAMAALDKFVFEKEFYDGLVDNVRGHLTNALKTGTSPTPTLPRSKKDLERA